MSHRSMLEGTKFSGSPPRSPPATSTHRPHSLQGRKTSVAVDRSSSIGRSRRASAAYDLRRPSATTPPEPTSGGGGDGAPEPGTHPTPANTSSSKSSRESNSDRHRKQRPEAEKVAGQESRPVSGLSLPQYRQIKPKFYWPQSSDAGGRGPQVVGPEPGMPYGSKYKEGRISVGQSDKSRIYSAVFETEDGKSEHLAVKIVLLDELGQDEPNKVAEEFKTLLELEHNHIIAAVGAYVDGTAGNKELGILLFPLAPLNLKEHLNTLSAHNESCRRDGDWKRHPDIDTLVSYFACLCRAVLYLHDRDKPIKHRDIKPDNILIDGHKTVMLADFDIAKRYTSRSFTNTSGPVKWYTAMYAPENVKEQRERDLDWDIYALGCVFLEMATVIFGETLTSMSKHLIWGKETNTKLNGGRPTVNYDEAFRNGHVKSWIVELQAVAAKTPAQVPMKGACVGQLLEHVYTMMSVTPGTHKGVLERAWTSLSGFCQECQHCHPRLTKYGNPRNRLAPPRVGPPSSGTTMFPSVSKTDPLTTRFASASSSRFEPVGEEEEPPSSTPPPTPAGQRLQSYEADDWPEEPNQSTVTNGLSGSPIRTILKKSAQEVQVPVISISHSHTWPVGAEMSPQDMGSGTQAIDFAEEKSPPGSPTKVRFTDPEVYRSQIDLPKQLSHSTTRLDVQQDEKEAEHTRTVSDGRSSLPGHGALDSPVALGNRDVPPPPPIPASDPFPREPSPQAFAKKLWIIDLCHRQSTVVFGHLESVNSLKVLWYDPTAQPPSFTVAPKSSLAGKQGVAYRIPWRGNATIQLPGRAGASGEKIKLRKALALAHNTLRHFGVVKLVFVPGIFNLTQLEQCAEQCTR